MIIGKFIKQPSETMDYDIDFSEFLTLDDTLVGVGNPSVPSPLNVVVEPVGLTLGPTVIINSGKTVKQWLSGGTNGVNYKITLTLTSAAGRVKQVEFKVRVKEE